MNNYKKFITIFIFLGLFFLLLQGDQDPQRVEVSNVVNIQKVRFIPINSSVKSLENLVCKDECKD